MYLKYAIANCVWPSYSSCLPWPPSKLTVKHPLSFFLVNGEDFDGANFEATFAVGTGPGDTACANISIIDDATLEGDHSFTVSLDSTTPSGVNISIPSASTTVNIEDNDSK